jgi:hypothetical protein
MRAEQAIEVIEAAHRPYYVYLLKDPSSQENSPRRIFVAVVEIDLGGQCRMSSEVSYD